MLNQHSIVVFQFVLNDMHSPACMGLNASLQFQGLIFDLDRIYSVCKVSDHREATNNLSSVSYAPSFLRISGLSITVYVVARPFSSKKSDNTLLHTDHIGRHTDTAIFVCYQHIEQLLSTYKSSFVAVSDFYSRNIWSCIVYSFTIIFIIFSAILLINGTTTLLPHCLYALAIGILGNL